MMARVLLFCALCLFAPAAAFQVAARAPVRSSSSVTMAAGLKAGDSVKVISGADKGEVGKVLFMDKKKGQVIVEGMNVRTKHIKPRKDGETGQLLKKEMPIHISNVAFSEAAAPEESSSE